MTAPELTNEHPEGKQSGQLTVQQQLVLEQRYKALEEHAQAGDHLDGKASALLQAGSLIIALSGAVSIPTFVYQPPSIWAQVGIIVAFAAYGLMLFLSILAWLPSKISIPGEKDWNTLFRDYLYEDTDTCYRKVLSDLIYSSDRHLERNARKARYVRISAWLLGIQIAGILVLALTA